jgi:hypothetical protein
MQAAEWRALSPDDRIRKMSEQSLRRFWSLHKKEENGCWIWQGTIANNGYGKFGFCPCGLALAHRIAFIHSGNELLPGKFVLHRCDTPACVNPEHLFSGTQKDNMLDCAKKNRSRSGNETVTPEQVMEIRRLAAMGHKAPEIARRFGVTYHVVNAIIIRKTWQYLPDFSLIEAAGRSMKTLCWRGYYQI